MNIQNYFHIEENPDKETQDIIAHFLRIIRNTHRANLHKEARRKQELILNAPNSNDVELSDQLIGEDDVDFSCLGFMQNLDNIHLYKALNKLSKIEYNVIFYRFFQCYTFREIVDELHISSLKYCYLIYERAIKKLRKSLRGA